MKSLLASGLYRATDGLRFVRVTLVTISATWRHSTRSAAPTLIPATDTRMRGNVANLGRISHPRPDRTPVPSHSRQELVTWDPDEFSRKPRGGARSLFSRPVPYGPGHRVESPDVPSILEGCEEGGLAFDMMQTTFFLSHETFVSHQKGGMARWRKRLFGRMSRNSLQATAYFGIPPNRVVELGMQVQL